MEDRTQVNNRISNFYKDRTVLVTGHTGFKGSWLCKMLELLGARVVGYALCPREEDELFALSGAAAQMDSVIGDVRDLEHLRQVFEQYEPQVVFHLAAQPLVRESYRHPVDTYETNVMGTVHLLECVRSSKSVRSVLNITTDKVYENREWSWGYRESDPLDGYDPYSNSKSCSELVTHSYKKSFLDELGVAVSTVRAGNVIGGGDFAKDRIIPDCVRAAIRGEEILLRNPDAIRPFQHVLEPLYAYLFLAAEQVQQPQKQGYYNVGPNETDCVTVGELATLFCDAWQEDVRWRDVSEAGPHEASFLKLDCSLIRQVFGWTPMWNIAQAVEETVRWSKVYRDHGDVQKCMEQQILAYLDEREQR